MTGLIAQFDVFVAHYNTYAMIKFAFNASDLSKYFIHFSLNITTKAPPMSTIAT